MRRRTSPPSVATSKPATVAVPVGGIGERREDAHRRRLAGTVRAEHGGDGAGVHVDVDAGEGDVVAVALDEAAGDDGVADVEIGRGRGGSVEWVVRR